MKIITLFPKILKYSAIGFLALAIINIAIIYYLLFFQKSIEVGVLMIVTTTAPIILTLGLIFSIWSYIWNSIIKMDKSLKRLE